MARAIKQKGPPFRSSTNQIEPMAHSPEWISNSAPSAPLHLPGGKELFQFRRIHATPRSGLTAEGTRIYRASKLDCDLCELKARCCTNDTARKISRDLCVVVRALAATLAIPKT